MLKSQPNDSAKSSKEISFNISSSLHGGQFRISAVKPPFTWRSLALAKSVALAKTSPCCRDASIRRKKKRFFAEAVRLRVLSTCKLCAFADQRQ